MAFCGARRGPLQDRALPDVLFVLYRALAAATLFQPVSPWRDQSQWLAQAIGRRVHLRECVPFLRARIPPLECWAICLRVRLRARVQLLLLLA